MNYTLFNTNMNNNRQVVLSLYRAKIRICRDFGYILGKPWDEKNVADVHHPRFRKLIKRHRKRNLGGYLMDNIQFHYKTHKYVNNPYIINELIDDGFIHLRKLNDYHLKYRHRIQKY